MKRFLAISLVLLALSTRASACAWEGPMHNYYMMQLYPSSQWGERNQQRIWQYWSDYTGGVVNYFDIWDIDQTRNIALQKTDNETVDYLSLLEYYFNNMGEISRGWDYPTAEELNRQNSAMNEVLKHSREYKGQRLRPQYALMQMRANMQLEHHQDNINFWNETGSKMPESVYRDLMKNIYAGALLRTGKRLEAWNIYAEQGDYVSLRWSVFKYRNLAGIKKIYADYPNAPVLDYLVQDFANNAQETYDNLKAMDDNEYVPGDELIDWVNDNVNMVGCNPVYEAEIENFITFAKQVVAEKKSQNPALWMTAAGWLHYLMGRPDAALSELDQAMKMDGTARTKENTRAIRLLVATQQLPMDKKFSPYVVKELKWLEQRNQEMKGQDCYFEHAHDRIVNLGLIPRYRQEGDLNLAAALTAYGNEEDTQRLLREEESDWEWNQCYGTVFFSEVLNNMKAEDIKNFNDYINAQHKDELERMVVESVKKQYSPDFFTDLIGTKYLSEGNFKEAAAYLEKVPVSFLETQNISWYMGNRDYAKARWFGRQTAGDEDDYTDGPNKATLTANKKLQFCRDMQQLMARRLLAGSEQQRRQVAYELAVRYYQASPWGDCWFLSDYGWSSYREEGKVPLFVESAINCLNESKNATDAKLRLESLYALAYIPVDQWLEWDWSIDDFKPMRNSQQWNALTALDDYIRQNPEAKQQSYITKCDVLKQFRKQR